MSLIVDMATQPSSSDIQQIGQQHYLIQITVFDFINKPYKVPFYWVDQLVIEETLMDWNTVGYLSLKDDLEFLERGFRDSPAPLTIRTDGRNKINIKIIPLKSTRSSSGSDPGSQLETDPEWEINHDFIIYDVQDVSSEIPGKTMRTYYFKDERHQIFEERILEWSTSKDMLAGLKDEERVMSGNEALKKLIEAATKVEGVDTDVLRVGFTDSATIDKPDIPVNSFGDWDPGTEDKEDKIFYTSPAFANVLNDITYILPHTKSKDGSPVILDLGRNTLDKKWKLISLTSIFENSKNQIEKLLIKDTASDEKNTPPIQRSYEGNLFTNGVASIVSSYNYVPAVASNDLKMVNSPIYNYSFKDGKFNVYFEKNKMDDILKKLKEITKGLYSFSGNQGSGQIVHSLNKTKMSGISTRGVFMPQTFFVKECSSLQILKDLIFLSGTLYVQLPGLTKRTPGKFVYLDRPVYFKNNFDDRFLGQWLVTKVTHMFTHVAYMNDMVCTKIDALNKIFPETADAY